MVTASKLGRGRRKRSRTSFAIGIAGAILVVSIGVIFVYTRYFQSAPDASALLPEQSSLYISFAIDKKGNEFDTFREKYNAYSGKRLLGTSIEKAIRNSLSLAELDYDTDIKPWIGDELAIGKTSQEPGSKLVFFAKVKDANAAKQGLAGLESDIKGIGKKVQSGSYKGVAYTSISLQGKQYVATFVRGYIVVGLAQKDIERIIDVATRGAHPLASYGSFQTIAKQTRTAPLIFMYTKSSPSAHAFGGSLIPADTRLEVKFQAEGDAGISSKEEFAPHAFDIAPIDAALVLETGRSEALVRGLYDIIQSVSGDDKSLDEFMQSIERDTKTEVKDPLFELGNTHMTIAFLPRVSTKIADIGVVFETASDPSSAIKKLEPFLLTHATGEKKFQETAYKNTQIRFLSLDYLKTDLNYAVIDKKIIVSNSKQGIQSLIDTITGKRETLKANSSAQESFAQLNQEKVNSFAFVDVEALLTSVFTQAQTSEQELLNQGSSQILRLVIQLFTHAVIVSTTGQASEVFSGLLMMK